MPVPTHPALLASGNANHERIIRNILCHDCPGCDEGIASDGNAADDGGIGAY
jgi:hypothetical protein